MSALHLNCFQLFQNCRVTHSCDFLASHLAEEVLCDLLAHHTCTGCVTPALLWWLPVSMLHVCILLSAPCRILTLQPAKCCLCGTSTTLPLQPVASGTALSLLSRFLRLFWEGRYFKTDSKVQRQKVQGQGFKCNRLYFFNVVFFCYLPCLWAVVVLLDFISSAPCMIHFWEFFA